jgi:predicted metalloprotease with PDZ domain
MSMMKLFTGSLLCALLVGLYRKRGRVCQENIDHQMRVAAQMTVLKAQHNIHYFETLVHSPVVSSETSLFLTIFETGDENF